MTKLKAIIFDCFGVLVEASLEPFCRKYFGDDIEKNFKVKELDKKSNSGLISYEEYVVELANLAHIPVGEARQFLDHNPANLELLDYIREELSPKYKIGFLSNASDNWLGELFTPEQLSLFNDIVLSFQHGVIKPDPDIFRLAAQRLSVEPSECLFVDDIAAYCEGAKEIGMQAICYTSSKQLKGDLDKLLSSSNFSDR